MNSGTAHGSADNLTWEYHKYTAAELIYYDKSRTNKLEIKVECGKDSGWLKRMGLTATGNIKFVLTEILLEGKSNKTISIVDKWLIFVFS